MRARIQGWHIGTGVILIVVTLLVVVDHIWTMADPLRRENVRIGGSMSSSCTDMLRSPSSMGGFKLANHTGSPMTILSVKPTNVPADAKVVTVGIIKNPPNADTFLCSADIASQFLHLPYTLASSSRIDSATVQPVIVAEATQPHNSTIEGLLIDYEWRGHRYEDYFPDQFYVASGQSFPPYPSQPPPKHWPVGSTRH